MYLYSGVVPYGSQGPWDPSRENCTIPGSPVVPGAYQSSRESIRRTPTRQAPRIERKRTDTGNNDRTSQCSDY